MPKRIVLPTWWRPVALAAIVVIAAAHSPAVAQQVVVSVNGDPITALDIAQRTKLIQISAHRTPTRQEVVDELIDEKLKLQVAKRYKLEITDKDVDGAFDNIATRAGTTPQQFAQSLGAQGISADAVKARIRADMGWSQIIRGKFQSNFQIRERDILDTLQSRRKDEQAAGSGGDDEREFGRSGQKLSKGTARGCDDRIPVRPMSRPLALTIGEPAGIGPDLALIAWRRRAELALSPFYLLSDPTFVARRAARLGLDVPIKAVEPSA